MGAFDESCGCSQCSGDNAENAAALYRDDFARSYRMDSCSSYSLDDDYGDDLDLDDDDDYDDDDYDDDIDDDLDLDLDLDLDDGLDLDLDGYADYELDNTIKRPCRAVRSIKIRKDRAGERPWTQEQQNHLCEAAQIALRAANGAKQAIDAIWNQSGRRKPRKRRNAWRSNARFTTWFGNVTTQAQISRVRHRIGRIRRYLDKGGKFIIIQHQDGRRSWKCPANAYTPAGGRIRLCPTGLDQSAEDLARTILHELVHWLGWGHARLPGFGVVDATWSAAHQQAARDLARDNPGRARRNPVNYAMFFMQFA